MIGSVVASIYQINYGHDLHRKSELVIGHSKGACKYPCNQKVQHVYYELYDVGT